MDKNPDKVPYKLNHSSKISWPEKLFSNLLKENNITGWVYNYQVNRYSYDFAFPELKVDIEIDGATHNLENVKRIDIERDKFTKKNGWVVVRIDAKRLYNAQELKHVLEEVQQILGR